MFTKAISLESLIISGTGYKFRVLTVIIMEKITRKGDWSMAGP